MKKTGLFLIFFALSFFVLSLDSSLNDATDFILLGIASFFLALAAFIIAMVVLNLFRMIRYRRGSTVGDDGFHYHGPINSVFAPWNEIDSLKIEMVSNLHVYSKGIVRRSKMKFPELNIHWAKKNKDLPFYTGDMPRWLGVIQEHLREKSPIYTQHEIDWVAKWIELDHAGEKKRQASKEERATRKQ